MVRVTNDNSARRMRRIPQDPIMCLKVHPFPNKLFRDRTKFKEAADNNLNLAIKGFQDTDCKENLVEKGTIAHFEQFQLFRQFFSLGFFSSVY